MPMPASVSLVITSSTVELHATVATRWRG